MKDQDFSRWCDYVRGCLTEAESRELAAALETADEATREMVAALRRVAEVGAADALLRVPESSVRMAKALGSLHPARGTAAQAVPRFSIPYSIVFDSLSGARLAGARDLLASQRLDRLVSIRAAGYAVDLSIEEEQDQASALIVGQVVQADASVEPLRGIPAMLSSTDEILDSMLTSEQGEFQLRGPAEASLVLSLRVTEGEWIELPLSER